LFNGNISETFWKTDTDNFKRSYGYQYDNLNRLTNAIYQKQDVPTNSYNERLTYDPNGNIITMYRTGYQDGSDEGMPIEIDKLVYGYAEKSNTLLSVYDESQSTNGFKDGNINDNDFKYDGYGNMTVDKNKKIDVIKYNHLHLPTEIDFGKSGIISYIYNALGVKVAKQVQAPEIHDQTDYLSGFQYKNDQLQFFPTAEGYVKVTDGGKFNYVYNYTDHLGNIRVSYTLNPADGQLKILEENHYYPFGLKHNNYNVDKADFDKDETGFFAVLKPVERSEFQYKYNGKEFQDEFGLNVYDYGGRTYAPDAPRFWQIYPKSEKYYNISPYVYVANNPIIFIDPDGKEIIVANKKDQGAVLKMINSKALGTFAFNKSGQLYLAKASGDVSKFSSYYQKQLVAAINDKEKINISIAQTFQSSGGTTKDVDKDAGGGVTQQATYPSGKKEADVIISGNENTNLKDVNGNVLKDKPADILAHELVGHAIPFITKSDTGNAVDNENKVRKETKLPERKKEPGHIE
jgi:RHS repeat-associated protein